MAVFNPQVQAGQDNSPNYFKYSEPISQPKADTSTGQTLATLGEGVEGATKLADEAVKGTIKDDVYKGVDTLRDQFTSDLEAKRNNVVPAPVQTAAGSTTMSLAPEDTSTPVPAAVDVGLNRVDAIQSALVNGKINDTYYTQRLNSLAKDMRTQYPGYREYIDQRISEATGVNPANAYINNLMQDINRQGVAKDTELNKLEGRISKANDDHTPNADVMLQYLHQNPNDPNVRARVNEFLYRTYSEKDAIDLQNSRRSLATGQREDIATQRTSDFTGELGASISSNMHALVTIPGVDTPQGITDFIKTAAAHPEQYTDAQLRTLDSQLMIQKNALANQYMARANETNKDAQGRPYSYMTDIGASKVPDLIKSQLSVYDNLHDALTGGGPQGAGLAFWHANQVMARFADAHEKMLSGPLGNDIKTFKILQDDMGPTFSGILVPKLLNAGIDTKMAGLFNQSATEARAQPDFDGSGRPLTYMDHVKAAQDLQSKGQINDQMRARYQGELVKVGQDIQDPNVPDTTKLKVVNYLFSPEGQGLLGTFQRDYVNSQGQTVPGRYAVAAALTSQGMVDNISKLSRIDPTVGEKYKSYLENEYGSQLFYKEFQNLNRYTGHDDLHFSYNDGSNAQGIPFVTLTDKDGKPVQTIAPRGNAAGTFVTSGAGFAGQRSPGYLQDVQTSVSNINKALSGLGRVEKGLGGDVNSYLLNFLQHSQVDLGKNWSGLPSKLADAIAAARAPQKKIDEVFKDINP